MHEWIESTYTHSQGDSARAPAPPCAERVKVHVRQAGLIGLGDQELDLGALAQLVEVSQTRAVAEALLLLRQARAPRRVHEVQSAPSPRGDKRRCRTWKVEGRVAGSPPLGFSTGAAAELHPHTPQPVRQHGPRQTAPVSSHEPGSGGLSGRGRAAVGGGRRPGAAAHAGPAAGPAGGGHGRGGPGRADAGDPARRPGAAAAL